MDTTSLLFSNLLSPPVLFFALGVLGAILRSDLKIPEALYVTLTIYLLCAIGFKGGMAITQAGLGTVVVPTLAAVLMGAAIPLWCYPILRFLGKVAPADAAAIAAHYGSASAVTFIAATNFLKLTNQTYEPYSAAFLAVIESPAIIVGILLGKALGQRGPTPLRQALRPALQEALLGRSIFLLLGALAIGMLSGPSGEAVLEGFFGAPFQGVLCLFLLEMGTVAGRRLHDLPRVGPFLFAFGTVMPLVHGTLGVIVGHTVGLGIGGATLFGILTASASYIAAPAAIRLALPEANPALYLTSALAITFPFNLTLGIPFCNRIAQWWFGGTP
jgi:hypothetical protein